MDLIARTKDALEYSTPGPWRIHDSETYVDRGMSFFQEIWNDGTDVLVTTEVTRAHNDGGAANMRLIALTPDIARALIAADELAAATDDAYAFIGYEAPVTEKADRVCDALAAYRKAVGVSS